MVSSASLTSTSWLDSSAWVLTITWDLVFFWLCSTMPRWIRSSCVANLTYFLGRLSAWPIVLVVIKTSPSQYSLTTLRSPWTASWKMKVFAWLLLMLSWSSD